MSAGVGLLVSWVRNLLEFSHLRRRLVMFSQSFMEYKCSQLRLPRVGEVPAAVMVGERIPAKASQRPASFGTQQCAPHARPSVCAAGSFRLRKFRNVAF